MIQAKNNQLLIEGKWFDLLYAYQFIRRLITPFEKTEAFKLGIIDKEGNNLIPRKDLKTDEQKDAYSYFNILIFNLKKLLGRLPWGKTHLATLAAAVLLLKEEKHRAFHIIQDSNPKLLEQEYQKIYTEMHKSKNLYYEMLKEILILETGEDSYLEEEVTADVPTLNTQLTTIGKKRRDKMIRRSPLPEDAPDPEEGIDTHGDYKIFSVDNATFLSAKEGKGRYERYNKYVGNAKLGENIRNYAIANPKMPIILKDEKTGSLCFLKMGSNASKVINKYTTNN